MLSASERAIENSVPYGPYPFEVEPLVYPRRETPWSLLLQIPQPAHQPDCSVRERTGKHVPQQLLAYVLFEGWSKLGAIKYFPRRQYSRSRVPLAATSWWKQIAARALILWTASTSFSGGISRLRSQSQAPLPNDTPPCAVFSPAASSRVASS